MKAILKITIFIFVSVLSSCTTSEATPVPELESVSLKLNWLDGVQFLGFYMAQEQGYYADEGLIVDIEPLSETSESNTIPDRVAEGKFDFGIAGSGLIPSQAEGTSVTAIASILQFSPGAFFARVDSGINTPADFLGRRVVVKSAGWQFMLEALLAHADMGIEDIEPVSGGFDMTPFYEGDVEVWSGFLTNEVIRARQQGLDLVTFPVYEYGINNPQGIIISSQQLIEDNSEIAVSFLRATIQGWEWAIDNPTEAVDLMLEQFPELADDRDFHLASFAAYIPLVRPSDIAVGSIDCERWLNDERFEALDSIEKLCTTEIFESVTVEEN